MNTDTKWTIVTFQSSLEMTLKLQVKHIKRKDTVRVGLVPMDISSKFVQPTQHSLSAK